MSIQPPEIDGTLNQRRVRPRLPLAPPPKLRRRPALVAAAIGAICIGALLAGWAWTATTNTQEVLVARHTIERGVGDRGRRPRPGAAQRRPGPQAGRRLGSSTRSSASARPWTSPRAGC